MTAPQLLFAILDYDTPVSNVYAERGLYSDIFAELLKEAAANTPSSPDVNLRFTEYDCVARHLPPEQDLLQIDAVIITGSAASAYDPAPWIISLASFTKDLYSFHPATQIFGSCFGHQLLAHALFSTPTPIVVTRDPSGWELGLHFITLSPSFLTHFGPVTSNLSSPSQMHQQFVHADHVVLSSSLLTKEGFEIIGRSEHCALQGLWKRNRVLTYQGHAEINRFINGETINVFGRLTWEESVLNEALRSVGRDDDRRWAAKVILRFFMEAVVEREGRDGEVEDVLIEEEVVARL